MKYSFKSVIFAVTLGSFLISANIVKANDRDSAKNEVILVKGAEVNFANFMSKKAKKFVKTEDWVIFVNVVKLYNNSPAKFMALSSDKKAAFNEAAGNIEAKLSKVRGEEARVWKNKVVATANILNVLWNYQSNVEPTDTENTVTPVVTEMLGR
ncbi:hypothetical protein [Emticicia sp. 17c]|uniref:hypothetical protein n=1 Tax=Emticicia sp. 17c TaxID=3127704 RepID=UPI00301D2C8C